MKTIKNDHQLINFLISDVPGSNIFYKNLDGTIMWHTPSATTNIDQKKSAINLIGKTVFDFYSKESAEKCHALDIETIKIKKTTKQIISVCLLTGEIIPQLIIKKPYFNDKNILSGILVNCIDLSKLNNYISDPVEQSFPKKALKLKNNYEQLNKFKERLKEMLILCNLLELELNSQQQLHFELKNFIKLSICHYNNILSNISK